jgi:hypothetical protein
MFKTTMKQSNLYANSKVIALNVTNKEIEQYVGILIHMGTFTMSTPKDYRKQRSRYPTIADTMNPNRFCKIYINKIIQKNVFKHINFEVNNELCISSCISKLSGYFSSRICFQILIKNFSLILKKS